MLGFYAGKKGAEGEGEGEADATNDASTQEQN